MTPNQPVPPSVGYSILRTGTGDASEACVVFPHVETPTGAIFDAASRRLSIVSSGAGLSLPEVPDDVARLLVHAPERVLLVATDSLSAVRFSALADGFCQAIKTH